MNPIAICYRHDELCLVFESMTDAARFIEAQSPNPVWRAKWTFQYQDSGNRVNVTTTESLNIDILKK